VLGDKVPAENAAMVNAVMSRALDFCDAIAPGPHIGSSIIPVALACAELRGGCDGREFLAALAIGAEIAARFNLTEQAYDGFDPTGVCVPFGAVAVASRLLQLNRDQTWNALGIAFNRCGGSFQSNIDGTLSVRVNQGWVAHDAIRSARFARLGITGPQNFIDGIYGYLHLFARNLLTADAIVGGLGVEDRSQQMVYKKYPSCGATQALTDVLLGILKENRLTGDQVDSVSLTLNPYGFKLVGHEFSIGNNPTVDGQFSAQYCVANVLLRGSSSLRHFTAEAVCDPAIKPYIARVSVAADAALDERGHTAMDMTVTTKGGQVFHRGMDAAPGFPGNPLSPADHLLRFRNCMDFARDWYSTAQVDALLDYLNRLETATDVRDLIILLAPMEVTEVG
jgi:2-methylcitrate dehydratase PrpD